MNVAEKVKAHFDSRRRGELTPTSHDLLERCRNPDDRDSWQEFFDIYWRLIYLAAIKAGLPDQEAEEVVQETMICVSSRMGTFRYEPEKCSFKGWLMLLTRRRIFDCLRKRRKQAERFESWRMDADDPTAEIPDMAAEGAFEAMWTEEWRKNLLREAMDQVRRHVKFGDYEIYCHYRVNQKSPREVSSLLRVSVIKVHVVSYRVGQQVKREVERLEKKQL